MEKKFDDLRFRADELRKTSFTFDEIYYLIDAPGAESVINKLEDVVKLRTPNTPLPVEGDVPYRILKGGK